MFPRRDLELRRGERHVQSLQLHSNLLCVRRERAAHRVASRARNVFVVVAGFGGDARREHRRDEPPARRRRARVQARGLRDVPAEVQEEPQRQKERGVRPRPEPLALRPACERVAERGDGVRHSAAAREVPRKRRPRVRGLGVRHHRHHQRELSLGVARRRIDFV